MNDHIGLDGEIDVDGFPQSRYAESVALKAQPEWIDDLRDAHDAIEQVFVRKRGPLPFPRIEFEVYNQIADETGWHRIEYSGCWAYAYDDPPAGVVAAHEWLEANVDPEAFERWWRKHV